MDQLTSEWSEPGFVPDSPWEFPQPEDEFSAQWLSDAGGEPFHEDSRPAAPVNVDFDDPISDHLVKVLRRRVRDACNVNSQDDVRWKAIDWLFIPGQCDKEGLDFERVCMVLESRPTVVRARAVLQMWRAGVILSRPLPQQATALPLDFESEIAARVGFGLPVEIARVIWSWPSIHAFDIVERFPGENVAEVLRRFDASGLVAAAHMRLYFVARNPDILPANLLRSFSFAKSIHVVY